MIATNPSSIETMTDLEESASLDGIVAILRRAEAFEAPLSFAQQRLWFVHQWEPDSPLYNVPSAVRLRGALNIRALSRALTAIVERHEILRSVYVAENGAPRQIIRPPITELPMTIHKLEERDDAARERRLDEVLRLESRRPFDLANDLMLRATLIRLGPEDHVLLLVLHHIAADGWSMGVLHRELSELYSALDSGRTPSLVDLPVQYADYAVWERQNLTGKSLASQLDFWREQLAGCSDSLELPTDRPRPATQTFRGNWTTRPLPESLRESLKAASLRQGSTLFMTLLAAFKVMLLRYTGQEDIVVGTPVGGRGRLEIEPLIGLFLNTLVLRSDLSGNPTFRELLRRVRDVTLDAYTHQELPFDLLLRELRPDRAAGRNPLVQVLFVFQNFPAPELSLGSVSAELLPLSRVATGTAKFDLTFQAEESADGLMLSAEYNTDLFAADTISRMMANFQVLLEGIAANPDRPILELPLLAADEQRKLLVEWNDTRADYRGDQTVARLFSAQVERSPQRTALVAGDSALTYAELDSQSGRLARFLRRRGIGPGHRVGLCVDRSANLLVAVLAILKSGAAYVPLDPHFPEERRRFMAVDAELSFLISTTTHHGCFELPPERQLLLDADSSLMDAATSAAPMSADADAGPEDPAYVIYTSGSTGKPKGVVIPHRAVVNFLSSMAREPGLTADDTLVAVTTLSFDIAVLELFLPLTVGARIVLANQEETLDGRALAALLDQHGATCLQATPVTWRLLLETGWTPGREFKALVGGEALPKDLAARLIECGVELWNMYGPTETTVWSTCAHLTDIDEGITIGRPIANTTIRILDAQGRLCPIGVPGELYIGGAGLALGYWQRPELTTERFVLDPFGAGPDERLYRTGDLARWRSDGSLEHLGRLDYQVKLRGFRIELGEIEACLAANAAVSEAVVVASEEDAGQKRLVAYVASSSPPDDLEEQLRRQTRAALPDYMVPAQIVLLKTLPRTPNGKIDRRSLPAPAASEGRLREMVAPQTPTEELVLAEFHSVLGRADVGVLESFFDLGGHSLMAARLMARLRTVSGVDLPLRELFSRPTAAGLAQAIDALRWQQQAGSVAGRADDREEVLL